MSVLVVGAGPTGLVLALNLARRGVPLRIIDENAGPGQHSRAMAVQARTLEFYRSFGFADEIVAEGIVVERLHLRESGRDERPHQILQLDFTDLGDGMSPFPFVLTYPQDDHERFLVKKLADAGVTVERNTRLETFTQSAEGVDAKLSGPNGDEHVAVRYICGCDGVHSTVRETLGLGFAGGTYEHFYFVCDAKVASGFERDLFVTVGTGTLALMFPVRSTGMQRLIGLVPRNFSDPQSTTFDDIRGEIEPLLGTTVTEVNWFSCYRVHHRVAEHFRKGRAFIVGDAGHVHSPVGGQGMNTGIGDATNLGWKLADVVRGRVAESVLDTFEPERIAFAHALVNTTDRVFTEIVRPGVRGELIRRIVGPLLMTVGTQFSAGRHELFRTVSQTQINYAGSALSAGRAGRVSGGDRLPWVATLDNFAPLSSLDWQVHCYGSPGTKASAFCKQLGISLHAFAWNEDCGHAGFARDAHYLVRPDGYVAAAVDGDDAMRLESYADRIGLQAKAL
ncbi:MAG: FAD-dependent monooxygenase [Candidatus Eremiobacteraeota bacterium]|nr:FAD-dependent monooxygenase [Candidatus Eremiobacteraeota bacterium]